MPDKVSAKAQLQASDPKTAAKRVRSVFKRVSKEVKGKDREVDNLIAALSTALGLTQESLTSENQRVLTQVLGADMAARFMILAEDFPAISQQRATNLATWFDMFMQALKRDAPKSTLWQYARKMTFEFINALADKTIRS